MRANATWSNFYVDYIIRAYRWMCIMFRCVCVCVRKYMTTFCLYSIENISKTHRQHRKGMEKNDGCFACWLVSPSTLMTRNIVSFYFCRWLRIQSSLSLSRCSMYLLPFDSLELAMAIAIASGSSCYCSPVSCSIDSLPSPVKPAVWASSNCSYYYIISY